MYKTKFYALIVLFIPLITFTACQYDNYEEPTAPPLEYNHNVPGVVSFDFFQYANGKKITPYTNYLQLNNIVDTSSMEFYVYVFNKDTLQYANLHFSQVLETNENLNFDSIALPNTNFRFKDTNTLVGILNLNNNAHEFSGIYIGEINVLNKINDEEPTFIRSIITHGFIDYQGKFHFFTNGNTDEEYAYIAGLFNSENYFTASAHDLSNDTSTDLENAETQCEMTNNTLIGQMNLPIDESTQSQKILELNLTKTN